jgi:hypothetical protein
VGSLDAFLARFSTRILLQPHRQELITGMRRVAQELITDFIQANGGGWGGPGAARGARRAGARRVGALLCLAAPACFSMARAQAGAARAETGVLSILSVCVWGGCG